MANFGLMAYYFRFVIMITVSSDGRQIFSTPVQTLK